MTDLRTAAQQALEALETPIQEQTFMQKQNAITALEAALAEPGKEPLAWLWEHQLNDLKHYGYSANMRAWTNERRPGSFEGLVPLFTAPPQRKPPATIDEMFARMGKAPRGVFFGHDPMTIWMEAWRAAEQHHGIK